MHTSHRPHHHLLPLLAVLLWTASSQAATPQEAFQDDIRGLLQVLNKDTPTLADYQRYFGYNDSDELAFAWKACETKGQTAPLQNQDCLRDTTTAWSKKDTAPSFFLAWLKTQIPRTAPATIQSVQTVGQAKGQIAGNRLQVRFDKLTAVFWRPAQDNDRLTYGRLVLTELNGQPLSVWVQQAGSPSVLTALGMTALVRPLTDAEQKQLQAQAQARCAADPECAKRLAQQEKDYAAHQKEDALRTDIGKKFDTWCKANAATCEEQKNARQTLAAERPALAAQCNKDYQKCLPDVARWLDAQQALLKPFCGNHSKDCAALDDMRRANDREQRAWCQASPTQCDTMIKGLDKAILEVRAKTDNEQ